MSGGRGLDAWILEESVVDPPGWGVAVGEDRGEGSSSGMTAREREYGVQPRLMFSQGNLNHRKFMHVIESGELCAGPNG